MSIPLTPSFVTQGASLLLKVRDEGQRRGSVIEAMLDSVGLPADAGWAAAFVQFVGYWTHFEHEGRTSSWPFPMAGSFDDLVRFARERGALRDEPEVGDIAMSRQRGPFAHPHAYLQGGFVIELRGEGRLGTRGPAYYDCITIEGNTDLQGALDGARVCRVPRRIFSAAGDCFIRWAELDARGVTATPCERTEQVMGRVRLAKAA